MDSLAARVCAPAVHRCVLWAEQKAGEKGEEGREGRREREKEGGEQREKDKEFTAHRDRRRE